jgi:IS605 OrfB family transposase
MKLTLKIKLQPSSEQHQALLETMEQFNAACNYIAQIAFEHRLANKVELQKLVYHTVRERFGLSAQMTIRAIAKVVEAYKRDKSIQPTFDLHGAIVYDQRILSWKAADRISILTLQGRKIIPIVYGDYQADRIDRVRGQADLVYRDGTFYLYATIDVPEAPSTTGGDVLGIDFGIANLAVDSDGEIFSGDDVEATRCHYERMRASLQSIGTKSAKRKLKAISGRERRFKRNTNHVISKRLVEKALDTGRDIAIEDLNGIRDRITVRRAQRSRHHRWAFGELRQFVSYKAELNGVRLHIVDPRYTSKQCSVCGHIDDRNRPDQATFGCVACGFADHADHNAARNIRARALVMTPMVSETALAVVPGTSPSL